MSTVRTEDAAKNVQYEAMFTGKELCNEEPVTPAALAAEQVKLTKRTAAQTADRRLSPSSFP